MFDPSRVSRVQILLYMSRRGTSLNPHGTESNPPWPSAERQRGRDPAKRPRSYVLEEDVSRSWKKVAFRLDLGLGKRQLNLCRNSILAIA